MATLPKNSAGWSERTMHVLFVIGSAMLLLTTIYAFYQDQFTRREFPQYQERARTREQALLSDEAKAALAELKTPEMQAKYKALKAKVKESETALTAQKAKLDELHGKAEKIGDDLSIVTRKLNALKANQDALKSRIDSGVEKNVSLLAEGEKGIAEAFAEQFKLKNDKDAIAAQIAEIEKAETAAKRDKDALRAEYDDYETKLVKAEGLPVINMIKELPGANFVQPLNKIEQVVLPSLSWSVFFSNTPRVDRCATCHVGIDNPDPSYAVLKDENAVLKSHPRLDLFVGANSKHPYKKFGCTICHAGQPSAVNFARAAHSPRNAKQEQFWKAQYDWESQEFWDAKMLPMQYIEASCAKCHKGVTNVPEAPTLNEGRHLFRDRGCVNCHMGTSGGADTNWVGRVGPDLRRIGQKTNPDWARNWIENPWDFRPSTKMPRLFGLENHKDKAYEVNVKGKAHPRDPVEVEAISNYLFLASKLREKQPTPPPTGNVEEGRKLYASVGCVGCHSTKEAKDNFDVNHHGPDLSRVGEKLSPNWLFDWLKNPKHYWAETRMPNLRLSDTEAANLTAYLMSTMKKADATSKARENSPEEAFEAVITDKLAPTMPDPEVKAKLKNPLELVKNSLKLKVKYAVSNNERRDTGDGEWTEAQIAKVEELLNKEPEPARAAKAFYLGETLIQHYGCYGCHNIQGWTYSPLAGVNLNGEADKDLDKFDFGKAGHAKAIPETKWDWIYTKISRPRLFDKDKEELIKPFDRLKMPWFGYRENKGVPEHAKAASADGEGHDVTHDRSRYLPNHNPDTSTTEGLGREEIEKLVTFVMSLTNEPIPGEIQHFPSAHELAIDRGQRTIRELNCTGCHLASIGTGKTADGPVTLPMEALIALNSGKSLQYVASAGNGLYLDEDLFKLDFTKSDPPMKDMINIGRGTYLNKSTVPTLLTELEVRNNTLAPKQKLNFEILPKTPKADDPNWVTYGSLVSLARFKELTTLFFANEKEAEEAYSGGRFALSKQFIDKTAYERLAGTAALKLSHFESERRKSERKFWEPLTVNVRLTRGEGRIIPHIVNVEKTDFANDVASFQNAPPSLSFEGGKIQPDWLYGFLHNVKELRPGLHVRMPSFFGEGPASEYKTLFTAGRLSAVDPDKRPHGEKDVDVEPLPGPDAINVADVHDDAQEIVDFFIADAGAKAYGAQPQMLEASQKETYELGRRLVMETPPDKDHPDRIGLPCATCHSIGNQIQPTPKLAPNLANVKKRLRAEWFRRFITYPAAIYPWTNMPANFIATWDSNHDFNDPTRGIASEADLKALATKMNAVQFFLLHSGDGELGAGSTTAAPAVEATAPKNSGRFKIALKKVHAMAWTFFLLMLHARQNNSSNIHFAAQIERVLIPSSFDKSKVQQIAFGNLLGYTFEYWRSHDMATVVEQNRPKIQPETSEVGKVIVEIELANNEDEGKLEDGLLEAAQVRREKIQTLVDTGSTLLVLPEETIKRLGLRVVKERQTRFANGQTAVRKIYGPVAVRIMGRLDIVLALAAHPGTPALLGQIPLEGLDLMVDSKRQRLVPGHPDSPDIQVIEVF